MIISLLWNCKKKKYLLERGDSLARLEVLSLENICEKFNAYEKGTFKHIQFFSNWFENLSMDLEYLKYNFGVQISISINK